MKKVLCLVAALAAIAACGGAEKDPADPSKTSPTTSEIKSTEPTPGTETPAEPKPAPAPAPSYTHGKFVWFEHWSHDATNTDKTKAFYTELFGWTFQDQEMAGQTFTTINLADKAIGMIMTSEKVPKAKKAMWMGYISTADVDGAAAKAKEAGGTIHLEPTNMEGVGRFAVIGDKDGAVYGVVKTTAGDAKQAKPNMNEFGWMELWTKKGTEQAEAYYTAALGYQVQPFPMKKGKNYSMLSYDNNPYAGIIQAPQAKYANNWVPYVPVENVDEIIKKAKKAKGKTIGKPLDIDGVGRIGYLIDPSGAVIGVMTPSQEHMEKGAPEGEGAPAEGDKQ